MLPRYAQADHPLHGRKLGKEETTVSERVWQGTLTLPTMLAEGAMKQLSLMAGALLGSPITSRCRLTATRETSCAVPSELALVYPSQLRRLC